MLKRTFYVISLFVLAFINMECSAVVDAKKPIQKQWPFKGHKGSPDPKAIQRGLQVFKEVCAACHGVRHVAFRDLEHIGLSKKHIKAFAAEFETTDGPNEDGEMFDRPRKPNDKMKGPYPNDKAAAAANNGKAPPDLSLMVKARPDGANYLYSLMVGYQKAPEGVAMMEGQHYNPYFPGGKIMMAPPLTEGQVEYADGTKATVEQMAYDVTTFLAWTAQPEMVERKQLGIKVLFFLALMTFVFWLSMRKLWARVKSREV